jgi:hypothetical protein
MIVSIHQPAYLPWLGYFHRIAISDAHIILDHVQFEKNSFTNRNKVRTADGWCWLTVPVKTAGHFGNLPISRIDIANYRHWAASHWKTLRLNYSKAPFFDQHSVFFRNLYNHAWCKLTDLTAEINGYLLNAFCIATPLYLSSQMKVPGRKDELILNLCRELGASTYLSGPLGRNYLREQLFRQHGVAVEYDDYRHPIYPQTDSGFVPNMAAVDLLFNAGPASREILLMEEKHITG